MAYAGTRKRRVELLRENGATELATIRAAAYAALGEVDDPQETTAEVTERVNEAYAEAQSSGS